MANNLGSLSEFQIADDQPEKVGMRYAVASPSTPAQAPPLVGAGHGPELQAEWESKRLKRPAERYSAQEVETLFKDCEGALARLEKNKGKVDPGPLIAQIRSELLGPLCGEFIQLKRLETRKILEGMIRPQWRRQVGTINLNLFESVWASRTLANEVAMTPPAAFPGVARKVLDVLRAAWPKNPPETSEFPSADPVCQPEGN
jgi:hypothetical protein